MYHCSRGGVCRGATLAACVVPLPGWDEAADGDELVGAGCASTHMRVNNPRCSCPAALRAAFQVSGLRSRGRLCPHGGRRQHRGCSQGHL